jgi:hypothetical protein
VAPVWKESNRRVFGGDDWAGAVVRRERNATVPRPVTVRVPLGFRVEDVWWRDASRRRFTGSLEEGGWLGWTGLAWRDDGGKQVTLRTLVFVIYIRSGRCEIYNSQGTCYG